jgi:hypothetical protein
MVPVESATGIILFNEPEVMVENETFTVTIWSNPKVGRPDMIGMDNLPFLFNSGASFAGKLHGPNSEVLVQLDKVIFLEV